MRVYEFDIIVTLNWNINAFFFYFITFDGN